MKQDDDDTDVTVMRLNADDLDEWGLDPDDPDFMEKLQQKVMEALGEQTEVEFPQLQRKHPLDMCVPVDCWHLLQQMSMDTLESIGCFPYAETDDAEQVLMLFPQEWYQYIPSGMKLVDVDGEDLTFSPGVSSNVTSMGMLSYGVVVNFA